MLHIELNLLTPEARFMQCNFKMDRCKFHSIGFVGFVTKQMHTSRFLTEFTSCNGKMPRNSLPCWVISWYDKVHYLFASHQKSKDDQQKFTAFNKSMAEVNCVSLKDIRTFCHATRFRFSNKILRVSSVDSLLFLSELHLTLQLRFNFKESRL